MENLGNLSKKKFKKLIKNGVLVSIDLLIKNSKNEVLLGLRKNRPAQGFWFVPGGRIRKNETIASAFNRIVNDELSLNVDWDEVYFLNDLSNPNKKVFEHHYDNDNRFNMEGINTHYIVIPIVITKDIDFQLKENDQHSMFKWMKIEDLLHDNNNVHQNVKDYFKKTYCVPDDSRMYAALMSHYIHYDQQFWSRTQILLAVQGAGFIGGYQLKDSFYGPTIMIGTIMVMAMVLFLIMRDLKSCRINEKIMDELANKIFSFNSPDKPKKTNDRIINLRSDPKFSGITGKNVIKVTICLLLAINCFLAIGYILKFHFLFPCPFR